jgi:hypothetical protein
MPRHNHLADQRRWALPVPPEMRERQGLVIDVRVMRIICPWPPKRPLPSDEERLDALLAQFDPAALPASVCWCWVDRDPVPVRGTPPGWLASWARDRAVYRLTV